MHKAPASPSIVNKPSSDTKSPISCLMILRPCIAPEWQPQTGESLTAKMGLGEVTFKKYRQRGIVATGEVVFELIPLNMD
ncbi:hypothetical protein G3257_19065 [Janthinobacterium lividum]|uniref:hypothetical protein n=1 Tax=Janthinobacterium lividum TaxID=29581 RepID=UPI001269B730|nr:hypothetical protein [Janthinobacterium lividum]QKY04151.1 hypothetical protein G3257_19065 [Janthinobacterium lividum]